MASLVEAAIHCDLSERRFREMLDEGLITRAAKQAYDLDAVRVQYIRHLREVAAGRNNETSALSAEKARHAKEQADSLSMKNAQARGELLPAGEVSAAVTASFARVRAKLLAIPSKLAPVLISIAGVAEVKETIANAIHETLAELASTSVAGISEAGSKPGDD